MKLLIFFAFHFPKLFLICFVIEQLQNYYKIFWLGVTPSHIKSSNSLRQIDISW